MSLDVSKLEKVVDLAEGVKRARCPACAEDGGGDRSGQHLRIYPDGRFGCCVHARSAEHRKRIFALAGVKVRRGIKVRVAAASSGAIQSGVLGQIGEWFGRTRRTGEANCKIELSDTERTSRTPQLSLVLQQTDTDTEKEKTIIRKEFDEGVRRVRGQTLTLPYLTAAGDLVIPFASPERYHWWKSGQSVKATLAELRERAKEVENGTTF